MYTHVKLATSSAALAAMFADVQEKVEVVPARDLEIYGGPRIAPLAMPLALVGSRTIPVAARR